MTVRGRSFCQAVQPEKLRCDTTLIVCGCVGVCYALCIVFFFYFVLLQLLRINVIIITALNIYNVICKFINLYAFMLLLLCFYYTVQCIVIRPVCLFVGLCACLCVCGSVTTITRNCVHRSSPNWVCR